MDSVVNAVHIVLSIFLMIGFGMFLTHIGWLNDENSTLISRLVTKVALPCMIVSNLFTQYTSESLIASAAGILAPFMSLVLTMLIGSLIARLVKIPEGRRGVFTCMFTFSNSVFIGVPVAKALFGDEALPFTLLYYIANTSLFWSVGHNMMRKDGGVAGEKADFGKIPAYLSARLRDRGAQKDPRFTGARAALTLLGKILPIPLIVFVVCVALVLLNVKLPKFVMSAPGYIGNLVTPLSLFYTGIIVMRMIRKRAVKWQKGYIFMLLGRFAIAPMLFLAASLIFPMPALMRNALLVQASMPVMSQTPIVAASCGADEEYAAGGIALTTALSLIFIPLYMFVIESCLV